MNQLLAAVVQGERDGFDAVVIACCSDPGLEDAKELVSIPVTAPMEAAVATGLALGRLAVIAPRIESGDGENLPQDANWVRRLIHRYGGESSFAGVFSAPSGHPPVDEVSAVDSIGSRRIACCGASRDVRIDRGSGERSRRARLARARCDSVVLCLHVVVRLLDPIRELVPIPVLDPLIAPVRYAELLAKAGRKN